MKQTQQELDAIRAEYYGRAAKGESYEEINQDLQHVLAGKWISYEYVTGQPTWKCDAYRWKPKTVTHPGGEMPEPAGPGYEGKWLYKPVYGTFYNHHVEVATDRDLSSEARLDSVRYYKTKEDAIAAGRVMFNIQGDSDE